MRRSRSILTLGLAIVGLSACTVGTEPTAPSVIPSPPVAGAPTATPNVWDSRDELSVWMQSEVNRGSITLQGGGQDAVIHIELSGGTALLRGPDLDPQQSSVSSIQIRYRWEGSREREWLGITAYLRPVEFDSLLRVPKLFPDYLPREDRSRWVEQLLTDHNVNGSRPSYLVRFPVLEIIAWLEGSRAGHGVVEVDRIALVP